ncbi:hypothetical protein [Clostridium sp. D53t1_180928_C8]|uniref:hypothetical protein n=1 Tax=Clostridium sp. D53t1_180928_C8 TaxID=2787101 RepID=UPI0018AB80B6|nr:hypothetical protein [Clostridium sp. D53t1_180928_C8]
MCFSKRMGGKIPQPVATMLERKYGIFDNEKSNLHIVSGEKSIDEICTEIISLRNEF